MISKHKKTQGKRTNKLELHPRNPHNKRYDFDLLADSCPDLANYIKLNQYGNNSIDFSNPDAVKALNRALLNHFYGVAFWDIPSGFLCPPIPGRADYIHYLADLLADSNGGNIPRGKGIKVLDIGVGANCVYPIIGHQEYSWQFVGSDVNPVAIATCDTIIKSNSSLKGAIETRLQTNQNKVFDGIWKEKDRFDITLCNPPFHTSEAAMQSESSRKWRGVKAKQNQSSPPKLNFGGSAAELWCEGGETGFICRMVKESEQYANQCFWFTSLVSRQENLDKIYKALKDIGAKQVKTVSMAQGQKISRFVAWSFLDDSQIDYWKGYYWQS
ncbi:23S rRNA (adenine(1618)-N(6))-methyltransferase RlmF [Marinomonas sp. C2222]|uniref:Ribosomal RNA large subunit methyltransferase F n=1 Tax=Marinomonas sargassi TaxID=2984494 RepID=A0ABT2YWL6_9GAMM|nr:23S rRNA (adenine(1618)-N(6))-methyltransferase RlmF [Marinomonas sargassi]MCV2403964.1 23S rRNA (adenine(1618)-N(6))-methyltransferase RlmF [Marinomonas sargassi]